MNDFGALGVGRGRLWSTTTFSYNSCRRFSSRKRKILPDIYLIHRLPFFLFICELLLRLKPFCRTKYFAIVTKSCRHFEAKKCKQTYEVSAIVLFAKENFINLPWNSLTPNFVASFVFWGTTFSLNWSISDTETSTNLAAIILKTVSLQCYNHLAVMKRSS